MKQKILTIPSSETSPLSDVLLQKLKERQEFIARLDQDNKDLSNFSISPESKLSFTGTIF